MSFYTVQKFAKLIGVTTQTLKNWEKSGKLKPHHTTETGYRYYSEEQLDSILNGGGEKSILAYIRVLSSKEQEKLEIQKEALEKSCKESIPCEFIVDVGSSYNAENQGYQEIIKKVLKGNIKKIIIFCKDRLSPALHTVLETIAKEKNTEIEYVSTTTLSSQEEICRDLMNYIQSISDSITIPGIDKQKKEICNALTTMYIKAKKA